MVKTPTITIPRVRSSDNSRPFGYFAAGIICIAIGLALAWYGAGYERGNKYQATQYIIECAVSFGLIVTACLFVAQGLYLILVFVIGIIERPEARIISTCRSVVGEFQFAAEASDAQPIRAIEIANEADAIKFRPALLNVGVFLSGESASNDVSKLIIQPRSNDGARCIPDSRDLGSRRQHGAFTDNVVSKTYFLQSSIGRADVNAPQVHNNGVCLPNISGKPKVFKANLWSMTGEKFVPRSLDRILQLDSLPYKCAELKDGNNGEGDSRPEKTPSEPSDSLIIGRLLIFAFGLGDASLLTVRGWQNFYNERHLFGAALVGGGIIIGLCSLGVWWLNAFPSTWGWPV